jgi:hypothetical protein
MPHNAIHKGITALHALRTSLDGEPVLDQGAEIIAAAIAGEEVLTRELLEDQFIEFDDDKGVVNRDRAAVTGMNLGQELSKIAHNG